MTRILVAVRSPADSPLDSGTRRRLLEALGYEVIETVSQERREHNRFNLGPELVGRLERDVREHNITAVAVDNVLHSGQHADLQRRLSVPVIDRRRLFWDHLAAGGSPAAQLLSDRQACRLERRFIVQAQRDATAEGPDGQHNRLEALDRRCQELTAELEALQGSERDAVRSAHDDVDAHVVRVRPVGIDSTVGAFTESTAQQDSTPDPAPTDPVDPARPETTRLTTGPSTLSLTTLPALVAGLPAWYREAIPGSLAALERATIVLVMGGDGEFEPGPHAIFETVRRQTDGTILPVGNVETTVTTQEGTEPPVPATPERIRSRLGTLLSTVSLEVNLPSSDAAYALLSWAYEAGVVGDVAYGARITFEMTASPQNARELRRRVETIGGVASASDE